MIKQTFKQSVGPGQRVFRRVDNWDAIKDYLKTCPDIRKSVCGGCGQGTLYDKNNTRISISRNNTVDEVKAMVEKIRNGSIKST